MPSEKLPTRAHLYQPERVASLFNQMSATYGWVNLMASFGFSWWWRRQCVRQLPQERALQSVYDLMSGMGECWRPLSHLLGECPETSTATRAEIWAVDFSAGMMARAQRNQGLYPQKIILFQRDLLAKHDWPEADALVSCFGLKTFSLEQQEDFARGLAQFLKPGAHFSFLEISVPETRLMRWPYMLYLKYLIPLIGRVLMGNPEHYRLLGQYTENFGNARHFARCLQQAGLEAQYVRYFGGCASGVIGVRPPSK